MPESLAVVTVTWRSAEALRRNLGAIEPLREAFDLELILVDNASDDNSLELARSLAPWARFVANPDNRGFARACNQAAGMTQAPWLLFLNPDARIAPADLAALVETLKQRPTAALAGPALQDAGGRVWPSAYRSLNARNYWPYFSLFSPAWRNAYATLSRFGRALGMGKQTRPCGWLMGACILARRSAFEEAGRFPEAYHMYGEDAELGWSLRALGYEVLYVPTARAVHEQGHSATQAPRRTRLALFESLHLHGRRCRDSHWLASMGGAVRLDMRLRLLAVQCVRLWKRGYDGDSERRTAYRQILAIWSEQPEN